MKMHLKCGHFTLLSSRMLRVVRWYALGSARARQCPFQQG